MTSVIDRMNINLWFQKVSDCIKIDKKIIVSDEFCEMSQNKANDTVKYAET
jgi:hypothetical protein